MPMLNNNNYYSIAYVLLATGISLNPLYAAITDTQRHQVVKQIKSGDTQKVLKYSQKWYAEILRT